MTAEEKEKVVAWVNDKIERSLPITWKEMSLDEARAENAIGVFGEKYADSVKVYQIGDKSTGIVSREICGGPHVENTSDLGTFSIKKEESSSSGVRRIKAVLT